MRILITGASGFIGQHLIEDLATSDFDLFLLTRDASKKFRTESKNSTKIIGDINDEIFLINALKDIDIVINIAAEVRNKTQFYNTNVLGTQNIINAINANNVKKLIHISSVGVYGAQYSNVEAIISEEYNCNPQNEYEISKYESEKLLVESNSKNKFQLIILRPTNVYGEYHPYNALLNLIYHINSNKPFLYSKDAIINYVYVKDLTSIIIKLINDSSSSGVFNVGSHFYLKDFTDIIYSCLNQKKRYLLTPQILIKFSSLLGIKKLNTISNKITYSDKKLKTLFNYPYDYEKGLTKLIEHYKNKNLI